MQFLGPAEKGM